MEVKFSPGDPVTATLVFWFVAKTLPMVISGFSIYLGYKLFILGVTGEASIVVDAKNISGQLINAAPGLFFAVGGIVALIVAIVKGGKITYTEAPRSKKKHQKSRAVAVGGAST